jgi:hypothetical protein
MRSQYPETMTIVLQHQFWDLTVGEEAFEVGLSFGGVAERLVVPFDTITAFFDPAVQFGFQFETIEGEQGAHDEHAAASKAPAAPAPAPRMTAANPDALPAPAAGSPPKDPAPDDGSGGAEVVRLDRFRKK